MHMLSTHKVDLIQRLQFQVVSPGLNCISLQTFSVSPITSFISHFTLFIAQLFVCFFHCLCFLCKWFIKKHKNVCTAIRAISFQRHFRLLFSFASFSAPLMVGVEPAEKHIVNFEFPQLTFRLVKSFTNGLPTAVCKKTKLFSASVAVKCSLEWLAFTGTVVWLNGQQRVIV